MKRTTKFLMSVVVLLMKSLNFKTGKAYKVADRSSVKLTGNALKNPTFTPFQITIWEADRKVTWWGQCLAEFFLLGYFPKRCHSTKDDAHTGFSYLEVIVTAGTQQISCKLLIHSRPTQFGFWRHPWVCKFLFEMVPKLWWEYMKLC